MKLFLTALCVAWLGQASPAAAQTITIRVHAKVIVDPVDGTLPSGLTLAQWETNLAGAFGKANESSGNLWWRGYRLELVDVISIGQRFEPGVTVTGPSRYHYGEVPGLRSVIHEAFDNKTAYGWSETALNVFFSEPSGGSICGCVAPDHPTVPEETPLASIFSGIFPEDNLNIGYHLLHEIGHFFNLIHTFDVDGVADTIIDPTVAGRDAISWELFQKAYGSLTTFERFSVDHDAGNDNIAIFLYGSKYSSLTATQQTTVSGTITDSMLRNILSYKYYSSTYAQLSTDEKARVDGEVAAPPWINRTQDTIAMKLYGKYFGVATYGTLTLAQGISAEAVYFQRNRDGIARINGLGVYATLPWWEQAVVDDIFFNLMSYSEKERPETHLTEGQLDRWAEAANTFRRHVVSGYTRFVSLTGSNFIAGANNSGLVSVSPVRTVTHAMYQAGAAPGDDEILVIRPGNYNEQGRFNRACTLRATRNGPVVIGKP